MDKYLYKFQAGACLIDQFFLLALKQLIHAASNGSKAQQCNLYASFFFHIFTSLALFVLD